VNRLKHFFTSIMVSGLVLGASVNDVSAQVNTWSIVGAGCVPTGQTSAGALTFNSAGDVSFATGKIGEIIVTCPVPDFIDSAVGMTVVYRDSDGAGTLVNVQANLRKKDLLTGQASNAGAIFNSDSGPVSGTAGYAVAGVLLGNPCNGNLFHFDHNRYAYYVQINMKRSNTAQGAIFGSVKLGNDLIC
jgi:hypothetical protein